MPVRAGGGDRHKDSVPVLVGTARDDPDAVEAGHVGGIVMVVLWSQYGSMASSGRWPAPG